MTTSQFQLTFERKIGYSFIGLLVGNLAMLLVLVLLSALLKFFPVYASFYLVSKLPAGLAFEMWAFFAIFSMPAWAVVGIPFVLSAPARVVARWHWLLATAVGAVLGICSLLLIFLALDRGSIQPEDFSLRWPLWMFAAVTSGVALVSYWLLVKRASAAQRKNGAPSSAPQFFSVF